MTAAVPWPPAFAGTPAVSVIERAIGRGRLSHSLLLAGDDAEGLSAAGLALSPSGWRERFAELEEQGATAVAYQPAGPDIPRELEAFAKAVRG